MSKRKRTSKIDKWIKEGRGTGSGADYQPWLKIQDVSSLGRSTRLKGIKTARQHEFLSDLERNYFYLTEFSDVILDIREQFPLLPQEETIVIAEELGIKHPADPKTGDPIVMTTDFLLTVDKGQGVFEVAHTIKMKDKLLEERVLEKFEIERENRSLSMLILSSFEIREWKNIYDRLLINLVNDSGTWTSKSLKSIEGQGVTVVKAKHSSKGVQHRAEVLLNKLDY
ncbi:Tn7-like element transposition protein TnsE [Bacillus pseudomycoides]|uniref:Tn7-like element transposition protein TnsE n=1 Tax=Bacillus pseudomycoides TaxID=64104 RepID=UPI000BEDDF1E|nr:Tn7-like element transposition protein TnsE [Bacillus pseudomycoides]PED06616.1 transposase [Bacillus pseudomycoides]PEI97825.1 transposase [Bacillus pseudomycoides]PEK13491.1 transposase [Bacillus pseudomycoides]PEM77828.1 transposase [Bacillus pseudomycoides]PEO21901.1 transposase [Bacillus pseudomycoides]